MMWIALTGEKLPNRCCYRPDFSWLFLTVIPTSTCSICCKVLKVMPLGVCLTDLLSLQVQIDRIYFASLPPSYWQPFASVVLMARYGRADCDMGFLMELRAEKCSSFQVICCQIMASLHSADGAEMEYKKTKVIFFAGLRPAITWK